MITERWCHGQHRDYGQVNICQQSTFHGHGVLHTRAVQVFNWFCWAEGDILLIGPFSVISVLSQGAAGSR